MSVGWSWLTTIVIVLVLAAKLHRGREGSRGWEHWREFLRRLRFCVLDEAHTYSGVLGCHTANLMRRYLGETRCAVALCLKHLLSRCAVRRLYTQIESLGRDVNSLQFIVASATVGNAVQMASKLIAREGFPVKSFLSLASSCFLADKRKLWDRT